MEKYTLDGESYYYKNGKWLDSHFVSVPMSMMQKLNKLILDSDDYRMKSAEELMEIIDNSKGSENLQLAGRALEDALDKANSVEVRKILPRLTSFLRKMGDSQRAIQICKDYTAQYGKAVYSSPLFTSIAAAYCDIGDFTTAKKFADRAFAFDGKGSGELSSVYGRIHKGLDEEFDAD